MGGAPPTTGGLPHFGFAAARVDGLGTPNLALNGQSLDDAPLSSLTVRDRTCVCLSACPSVCLSVRLSVCPHSVPNLKMSRRPNQAIERDQEVLRQREGGLSARIVNQPRVRHAYVRLGQRGAAPPPAHQAAADPTGGGDGSIRTFAAFDPPPAAGAAQAPPDLAAMDSQARAKQRVGHAYVAISKRAHHRAPPGTATAASGSAAGLPTPPPGTTPAATGATSRGIFNKYIREKVSRGGCDLFWGGKRGREAGGVG